MSKRKSESGEITESAEPVGITDETVEKSAPPENSVSAAEKKPKSVETGKKYIYVGASKPGYSSGTVFDEIPEVLNKPVLRELCIDINELGNFRRKAAVTTSREAFLIRKSKEV